MRRLAPAILVAALVVSHVAALDRAAAAATDPSSEKESFSLVNDERTERGLVALRWSDSLARIARDHSEEMAREGELSHNSDLPDRVDGWERLGENVGVGESAGAIHRALMASDAHRRNVLGGYTLLGVGAVRDGSSVWLTQVFMKPAGRATSAGTRTPVAPTPRVRAASTVTRVHAVPPAPPPPPPLDPALARTTLEMLDRLTDDAVTPAWWREGWALESACARDPGSCPAA